MSVTTMSCRTVSRLISCKTVQTSSLIHHAWPHTTVEMLVDDYSKLMIQRGVGSRSLTGLARRGVNLSIIAKRPHLPRCPIIPQGWIVVSLYRDPGLMSEVLR